MVALQANFIKLKKKTSQILISPHKDPVQRRRHSLCLQKTVGDAPGISEDESGGAGGLTGHPVPESGSSPW